MEEKKTIRAPNQSEVKEKIDSLRKTFEEGLVALEEWAGALDQTSKSGSRSRKKSLPREIKAWEHEVERWNSAFKTLNSSLERRLMHPHAKNPRLCLRTLEIAETLSVRLKENAYCVQRSTVWPLLCETEKFFMEHGQWIDCYRQDKYNIGILSRSARYAAHCLTAFHEDDAIRKAAYYVLLQVFLYWDWERYVEY